MSHTDNTSSNELFPISGAVFHDAVQDFCKLDDSEIALLDAANTSILPDDNPTKFALDLHLRPDLRVGSGLEYERARRAYRLGVILGRRVIKDSILIDPRSDGVVMPKDSKDIILRKVAKHGKFLPPAERNIHGFLDRQISRKDPAHGFFPYLRIEDEIENVVLQNAWRQSGVALSNDESLKTNVIDNVPRGLKDIFRVYSLLEENPDKNWSVKIRNLNEVAKS